MKKKVITLFSFFILLLMLCAFGYSLLRSTGEDKEIYLTLKNRSFAKKNEKGVNRSDVKQERKNVYKELFFSQGLLRLQMKLISDYSELQLIANGTKNELIENLTNATTYMQEDLFYKLKNGKEVKYSDAVKYKLSELIPMQMIREIQAEKATYNYQTDLFAAENVAISRYECEGHKLPKQLEKQKMFMSGVADLIEISLFENEPSFKAYGLKAKYYGAPTE